jgi:hypothetical protein
MNTRTWKRIGASGLWALSLALLGGACGGTTANTPSLGSESHFLARCDGSCEGGLDCIGGICTRACLTASSSCAELSASASCTDQSVEPGAVAVCDVACSGTADCSALGDGYSCLDSFCRTGNEPGSATGNPQPAPTGLSCEPFADQSPPPDVRGFTIINRSSSVLYLEQFGSCGGDSAYSLVQVLRDGQVLNTTGGGCGVSCQETIGTGLTRVDHYPCAGGRCVGELSPDCPGIDCASPGRVALQAGATLFQTARLETVFGALPPSCVAGELPGSLPAIEAVNCYTKVIPQRGSYTLRLRAFAEPTCAELTCLPAVEVSQPSEWYFENQTIEITLP